MRCRLVYSGASASSDVQLVSGPLTGASGTARLATVIETSGNSVPPTGNHDPIPASPPGLTFAACLPQVSKSRRLLQSYLPPRYFYDLGRVRARAPVPQCNTASPNRWAPGDPVAAREPPAGPASNSLTKSASISWFVSMRSKSVPCVPE